MIYFVFEKELQEALNRLVDPDYQPSQNLCQILGCQPKEGNAALQSLIIRAIDSLKPVDETPPTTYIKLFYELLYYRYELKLNQEETAFRLNMSRRTINRMQRSAIHTLASILWDRSKVEREKIEGSIAEGGNLLTGESVGGSQASNWDSQLKRELNILQLKAPGALSDVERVINDALGIMDARTVGQGSHVKVVSVQPKLVAAVHPVLLEQVLISALLRLSPYASNHEISVFARLEDGNTKITLTCATTDNGFNERDFIKDIPISKDLSIEVLTEGLQVFLWITMPSVGTLTVLVVDDNEDMVRFYRDCTIGTRYHIIHIGQGQDLIKVVKTLAPDIIVLDVMLPDIDGWRLLMLLHENPETKSIPVIVCTVVREEGLALSLGATRYLAKPVGPREFIQTLDHVSPPVVTGDLTTQESSEEAG